MFEQLLSSCWIPPVIEGTSSHPALAHLNQLHREASKQQQQQKTSSQVIAVELGIPYGLETARAIRKRGSMGAQGADYFSIFV